MVEKRQVLCSKRPRKKERKKNRNGQRKRDTEEGDRQTVKREQMTSTCSSDFIKDINHQEIASDRKNRE